MADTQSQEAMTFVVAGLVAREAPVHGSKARTRGYERAAILFALLGFAATSGGAAFVPHAHPPSPRTHAEVIASARSADRKGMGLAESFVGRSGKLRAAFVSRTKSSLAIPA